MNSGELQMDGDEQTLVRKYTYRSCTTLCLAALLICSGATAETLYKYRGENGEWIYADRPPADGQLAEIRSVDEGSRPGELTVTQAFTGSGISLTARNSYYAPMEVVVEFETITGVDYPPPDLERRWLIPARSELVLVELESLGEPVAPSVQYRYVYVPGDPGAAHAAEVTYRVPFSTGTRFPVTQAYPDSSTHVTSDSRHSVDFAMPVGTNIVAARDGIVFEVASTNYTGGLDADRYANLANIVRILHDDGTYAVYAHLNWNGIRVQPGDRVKAGQYIADSGNTGYSGGPHLHFAVQRNAGMRVESLPLSFRGANATRVVPASGNVLTAYN